MRVKPAKSQSVRARASSENGVVCISLLLAAGTLLAPVAASAQQADAGDSEGLHEIVVTANRQSLGSQSVPISLTAIGAEELERSGITNATQLSQLTPGMFVLSSISAGSPRYTLRGISNADTLPAASSAVATYVDDVYQFAQYGITTSLYDVQRIEVLRGPQGTTFGRNTTGGAVAYFSQTPTNEFEGFLTARYGNGDRPQSFIEGALNMPLIDNLLAMRVSFHADSADNYIRDTVSGRERGNGHSQSGRVQLRWTPGESTSVNLTAFGTRMKGDTELARVNLAPGNALGLPPQQVNKDTVELSSIDPLYDDFHNTGATLRIEHGFGLFNLTAISHYRRTPVKKALDTDGLAADIFLYASDSAAKQYGQEVRLSSDPTQRLSGVVGAYIERDKIDDYNNEASVADDSFFKYNNLAHAITRTKASAAFANLTFKLTDRWSVVGGVRRSDEKSTVEGVKQYFQFSGFNWTRDNIVFYGPPPVTPDQVLVYGIEQRAKPWTWDATIDFKPQDSILLFARVAKGFRSGGFNPASAVFPFNSFLLPVFAPDPFQGESVKSYELGLKSTLLDRKLRFNMGLYHLDYSNQQVTTYPNGLIVTTNAGSSNVDGVELEIAATPIPRLELSGSVAYTDAKYDKYVTEIGDYSGNHLLQAPEWTINASVSWSARMSDKLDFFSNASVAYRSEVFFTPDNLDAFRAPAQAISNVRLGVESSSGKGMSVAAFVDNLTNRRALDSGFNFGQGYDITYYDIGRLYGAELTYKW